MRGGAWARGWGGAWWLGAARRGGWERGGGGGGAVTVWRSGCAVAGVAGVDQRRREGGAAWGPKYSLPPMQAVWILGFPLADRSGFGLGFGVEFGGSV